MSKYILALDLGTSGNRAIVFDKAGRAVSRAYCEFRQYYPKPGWVEQDPIEIWKSAVFVIREAIKKARVKPLQIAAMGIANQRETTVVWNARTGKPVYRAIAWQDRRTADMCEKLKKAGYGPLIRQRTGLLIDPYFSATKLKWILEHSLTLPSPIGRGNGGEGLRFGTVDSWVLWNLTGRRVHATDVSNASRTMLWNIKTRQWDNDLLKIFKVPCEILPQVKPSSDDFGFLDKSIVGAEIPITSIIGDQQAALFGQAGFNRGDLKITYGTGAFLLLNTGDAPIMTKTPLIATVAWQIGNKMTYALEGSVFSCGSVINWLKDNLHLIDNPEQANQMAQSIQDNGGVFFVPAFSGLGAPYWDPNARGIITGLTQYSKKEHIVRAGLEAIAHQITDVIEAMRRASGLSLKAVRADGGVCQSDFVLQYQADLAQIRVDRAAKAEATALGAAMLAGLAVGFWKNQIDLRRLSKVARSFNPKISDSERQRQRAPWKKAVEKARR